MKESDIQLQIIHWLKANGFVVGKTKTMGVKRAGVFCYDPYTFRGFPDLTGFDDTGIFFIEVKAPGGKQSAEQKFFQKCCARAGLRYILASSVSDIAYALTRSTPSPSPSTI